jgi:exonuclease SbcD
VLAAAMERVRWDLMRRPAGTRSVVVAHAFVAGAEGCTSERELAVGGAGHVPTSTFAGADYVALGHLHGPQALGERVRYAGSPVAFSFSEAHHRKSVAVVDLSGEAPVVETVPCPVPRPLAVLRGRLDALLSDARLAVHEDAWVQATLTDPVRPQDAMERLRRRFPHTAVLVFAPDLVEDDAPSSYAERIRGLGDADLVAGFVREVRGSAPAPAELGLVHEALSAGRLARAGH